MTKLFLFFGEEKGEPIHRLFRDENTFLCKTINDDMAYECALSGLCRQWLKQCLHNLKQSTVIVLSHQIYSFYLLYTNNVKHDSIDACRVLCDIKNMLSIVRKNLYGRKKYFFSC